MGKLKACLLHYIASLWGMLATLLKSPLVSCQSGMAKLNAPLLSFSASGKIADALVYFAWKGINVVRQYVIPSNPKTAAQTTQRGYLTAAVAAIHTAQGLGDHGIEEVDQVANAALASAKGKIMTWFNQMCKLWVDCKVATKVPVIVCDMVFVDKDVTAFNCNLYIYEETGSQMADGRYYFGTSKTNLVHSTVATIVAGSVAQLPPVDLSAFLTVGVKYFVQFRPDVGDPCEGADSGIYDFVAE